MSDTLESFKLVEYPYFTCVISHHGSTFDLTNRFAQFNGSQLDTADLCHVIGLTLLVAVQQ